MQIRGVLPISLSSYIPRAHNCFYCEFWECIGAFQRWLQYGVLRSSVIRKLRSSRIILWVEFPESASWAETFSGSLHSAKNSAQRNSSATVETTARGGK